MRRFTRVATLLVVVPALAGCNKDRAAETSAQPTTEAVAPVQLRLTTLELGNAIGADKRVTPSGGMSEFRPADTVYASAATEGTASAAAMTARWTYQDGQVVDETSQTLSPSGPAVTEFHISKPGGFPVGKYKVEILLNGTSVQTKDFEVK